MLRLAFPTAPALALALGVTAWTVHVDAQNLAFLDAGQPANSVLDRSNVRLRLDDPSFDLDPLVAETVSASVSSQVTGDSETIVLVETGPSTGRFEGIVQLVPEYDWSADDGVLSSRIDYDPWSGLDTGDTLDASAGSQAASVAVTYVRTTFTDRRGQPTDTIALGETVHASIIAPGIDSPLDEETIGLNVRNVGNWDSGDTAVDDLPNTGRYAGGTLPTSGDPVDEFDEVLQVAVADTVSGDFWVGPTRGLATATVTASRTTLLDAVGRALVVGRAGQMMHVEVFDASASGTITVQLSTDGTLDQETLTLTALGDGRFAGSIDSRAAGSATRGDGVLDLDAAGGETVDARYTDGHGGSSASLTTLAAAAARSALMVVGNVALGAGDRAIHDRLVADGWSVLPIDDGASTTGDATGHDLVLISSTVSSNQVQAKFRDVPVPVLVWEPYVLDDLGMTGTTSGLDYGSETGQTAVTIRDPGHPLSASFDGSVTITSTAGKLTYGRAGAGATGVSRVGTRRERLGTLAYETGDTMVGHVAPARRVSTFLSDTTAASLTVDGWALVDAAVCWAVGCDGLPVARFDTAVSGPNGRIVDFDASASTAADGATLVDYQWSFGDGGTGDGAAPRRIYPSADYRDDHGFWVALTVTDSFGRTATTARPLWLDGWRQREALLVSRTELLDAADAEIAERLRLRGVRTTSIRDSTAATTDADGKDLVLLSATVLSSQVGTTFRDVVVPVVVWETHLFDDMAMTSASTGDYGRDLGQPGVDIVDQGHPIVEWSVSGQASVDATGEVGWGQVPASATVVATSPANAAHAAIFCYDDDEILADGQHSPERRVGAWLGEDGAAVLTYPGRRLLDGVLLWALRDR
ncbi:MAG: PKD domain-containing protein [Acidobacteriota bacterium]